MMDEKLIQILNKVVLLTQQNKEFGNELRKRLEINSSAKVACSENERITNIEKYLGLDYYTDYKTSIIDYSYVVLPDVRAQLISDNREMIRFRYGTRYHAISFPEFCRYAHLQSEMLLNYYYDQINNSSLQNIKKQIEYYNPTAKGVSSANTLASISYNSKLWAFNSEFPDSIKYTIFDYIRRVRNDLSHRTPENNQLLIKNYLDKLKTLGIPLNKSGSINFSLLYKDEVKKKFFDSQIKKTDEYKEYTFVAWYVTTPYEDIISNLKILSNKIKYILV